MRSIKGKRQIRKGDVSGRTDGIKPDPIALSPLGCAHEERMRTYGQPVALPSKQSCGQPVALSFESIQA